MRFQEYHKMKSAKILNAVPDASADFDTAESRWGKESAIDSRETVEDTKLDEKSLDFSGRMRTTQLYDNLEVETMLNDYTSECVGPTDFPVEESMKQIYQHFPIMSPMNGNNHNALIWT